ncbi:MAG: thermonuclease family protein [Pseudomonadota bacterium]
MIRAHSLPRPAAWLLALGIALSGTAAHAETLPCKVVGVKDGDTVDCLTAERRLYKIRLAEIDAPEAHQDYGQRAKKALSAKVFGKQVHVAVQDVDRYGRSVGVIWAEGRNVNLALVEDGMAWCYRQYQTDASCPGLEDEAKRRARGLWNSPQEPVPPWEFRKARRGAAGAGTAATTNAADSAFAGAPAPQATADAAGCSQKHRCAQMDSCAEAQFYLRQCGLQHLDGNGDSIACNSRCR